MATVPVYQEYMNPLLAVLRREAVPQTIEELDRLVITEMKLAEDVTSVPHDPEKPDRSEVSYRIAWARTYLKKAGLLLNPKRGRWSISDEGKAADTILGRMLGLFDGLVPEPERLAATPADFLRGAGVSRAKAAALNDLGIGPYELVSLPTYEAALQTAAEAIRATQRPVGLVMWRGRHAWVMSGFESTADPRATDDFEVTGIHVHDPLYPHGSAQWGKSPKPNALVSPTTLGKQFVIRDRGRVNLGVPPGWLLVLPVQEVA